MKRFFAYEEYGAQWTTMSQDLTATCKELHGWQEYERGVEALSKVVASENNRIISSRKALSFPDLLIKVFTCTPLTHFPPAKPNPANSKSVQVSTSFRRFVSSHARLR